MSDNVSDYPAWADNRLHVNRQPGVRDRPRRRAHAPVFPIPVKDILMDSSQVNRLYDERLGEGVAQRIEAMYASALEDLDRRLSGLDPFPLQRISFSNPEHVWKFVTCMFAAGVYGNGCAILWLYRADVGRQIPPIMRSQFEAVVKLAYCQHSPEQASNVVDAEPFERWMTARGKDLRPELTQSIQKDALMVLNLRPSLLDGEKLKSEILAGKIPIPDRVYRSVYNQLDFDDVASLMDALNKKDPGWTKDLYSSIFRIGSLGTHHSVVYLRDCFSLTKSYELRFSASQHYSAAPDFLLQSSNYVIGLSARVAQCFHGDIADPNDPLHEIHGRQQEIVAELRAGKLI